MASETPLTDAAVIHIPETPYSVMPIKLYGQELVCADHARQLERALRMACNNISNGGPYIEYRDPAGMLDYYMENAREK